MIPGAWQLERMEVWIVSSVILGIFILAGVCFVDLMLNRTVPTLLSSRPKQPTHMTVLSWIRSFGAWIRDNTQHCSVLRLH